MGKKRIEWIDISKGIAILLVIFGHVSILPWAPYKKLIFSVHMPLFFIVAGLTASGKTGIQYIKKQTQRLIVPYVIVSVITVILSTIISQKVDVFWEVEKILWASGVPANYGPGVPITGEEFIPTVGAIWFLPCMWCGKILFGAILKYTEKFKEYSRAVVVLLISAIGFILGQYVKVPFGVDIAIFVTIFMYAGYLIKTYQVLEMKYQLIGIVALIFWYLSFRCGAVELSARFYGDFPKCIFTILGAVGGSYIIFVFSREILQRINIIKIFLEFCGRKSLLILCVHHLEGCFIHWENILGNVIPEKSVFVGAMILGLVRSGFIVMVCLLIELLRKRIKEWRQI